MEFAYKVLIILMQAIFFAPKIMAEEALTCDYIQPNSEEVTMESLKKLWKNQTEETPCEQNNICAKPFNITYINIVPYYREPTFIEVMLGKCCGNCSATTNSILLRNITELTRDAINTSDFVFPILAREDTEMLYGFHFVPVLPIPSTYYVTAYKDEFLENILSIWPVIVVCLLMAIIAGFLCWIFEMWSNEEEFPKAFYRGLVEGMWWSFISMTTVGYGKAHFTVCFSLC